MFLPKSFDQIGISKHFIKTSLATQFSGNSSGGYSRENRVLHLFFRDHSFLEENLSIPKKKFSNLSIFANSLKTIINPRFFTNGGAELFASSLVAFCP